MEEEITKLTEQTKEKFGLDAYYLENYSLNREVNDWNDTIYTLVMEWFPNHISKTDLEDDDLNPDGTAIIEMDLHKQHYHSVIFVNNVTFANGIQLTPNNEESIIHWVESATELTYEWHFILTKREANRFYFHACINGIRTFPTGMMEVVLDEVGNLVLFAQYGSFPSNKAIQGDSGEITVDQIAEEAKLQLKLIHYPIEEREILLPIYAVEEVFITNNSLEFISYDIFSNEKNRLILNEFLIFGEAPVQNEINRELLEFEEEITLEEAFAKKPAPKSFPITSVDKEASIQAVYQVLQQVYEGESGEWFLQTLHRDNRYIIATLRKEEENTNLFKRKLSIIIDDETFEPLNYIDNNMMLDMYATYKKSEGELILKENAYEKLLPYFSLTPYYVYDASWGGYRLCSLLDCKKAIDATSGEVIDLADL